MTTEINKIFGKGEGGYVFISHSHQDIEKVRKIRNAMEEQGFEPLCFYLRCLTDDDEVEGLIKREIDAREWFVYIDSENARRSKWVKKERDYIQSIGDKKILIIDLDKNYDATDISNRLLNSMRVFLSYAKRDEKIVSKIRKKLIDRDLKVFSSKEIFCGTEIEMVRDELEMAAQYGCVLIFLTKETLNSEWIMSETVSAITKNALIIPVLVDCNDEDLPLQYEYLFRNRKKFAINYNSSEYIQDELVKQLENMLISKFYE